MLEKKDPGSFEEFLAAQLTQIKHADEIFGRFSSYCIEVTDFCLEIENAMITQPDHASDYIKMCISRRASLTKSHNDLKAKGENKLLAMAEADYQTAMSSLKRAEGKCIQHLKNAGSYDPMDFLPE